ncbi:hypothetical protein [Chryseobacterium sp. G0201]|uniref:hypothetical protein n=1 Tax=Chryseobacterium sp. G0201 TaxID=2487065 RepID=UPI000F4DA23A|nr:hypothetical protein [Chryseobacterium sp. G0201]
MSAHTIYSHHTPLVSTTNIEYFNNNPITSSTQYTYGMINHHQLTKQKTTFPDASINETTYNYANEKGNQLMIDKNMIGIPLETSTTQTIGTATKMLAKSETVYPKTTVEIINNSAGLVLPLSVKLYDISNLSNTPSTEITYDKYDVKGNLQQYTTKDGVPVAIIWGYNNTQPIAKIEGAKLSDIQQSFIDSIVNASNTDALATPNSDETLFLSVLNTFKNNLPNYQVTTYTYDPLIGVRSITPPSGIREVYFYDTANRLKEIKQEVKNANGSLEYKILKEFNYNYKN